MSDKRRFSRSERASFYASSGGKCSECGKELPREWHADHVTPYSKGGETSLENGQSLCPECNLKKGNRMLSRPMDFKMRQWQQSAIESLQRKMTAGERDFLAVATPGAGKTRFALWTIHTAIRSGYHRAIIVVPFLKLKEQWSHAATPFKVDLEYNFVNGQGWPRGFHGIVVTYAQVASAEAFFATLCTSQTIVVFDEIHHCGDEKSWGKAVQTAFGHAGLRISLSGTPFRHDDNYIPFVSYVNGKSKADYIYTYSQALYDGVCRFVYFPRIGGVAEYFDDGELMRRALNADLNADEESSVLRAVLDFRGQWNEQAFREANEKLRAIRMGEHKHAKGLVLAEDDAAAHKWATLIKKVTGIDPTLVTSKYADSNEKIDQFSKSGADGAVWIVAIRMVSEGVDIPDLRVAVFASRIKSEMFFRQAVGRIVRMMSSLKTTQAAYFYIPEIPTLINYAFSMKQERDHAIERREKETREHTEDTGDYTPQDFIVISSHAEMRGVIAGDENIEQSEIEQAKWTAQALMMQGQNYTPEEIATILRTYNQVTPTDDPQLVNMAQRKEELKIERANAVKSCAQELARRMNIDWNKQANKGAMMSSLNGYLKFISGQRSPRELSTEELEAQIQMLPQLVIETPDYLRISIQRSVHRANPSSYNSEDF